MSRLSLHSLRCGVALLLISAVSAAAGHAGHEHENSLDLVSAEGAFVEENAAAMEKMMAGTDSKPSGDVDRDFVAMMSAHHQGAIDMAVTMLKYGHNEQLKRMAQEVIVEQQQEIAAMNLAIGEPLPPSVASPTQTPITTPP